MKFKFKLPWWATILLLIMIAGLTECISVYLQPGGFFYTLRGFISRPATIALNFAPVLLTVLLGYFISGNIFWGASIPSFIWLILSYVNLLKIEGRDDAFVPADLGLIKEAFNSAASYSLNLHLLLLAGIILYCSILFGLGFFLKNPNPRRALRIGGGVGMVGIFAALMIFVYPSKPIYNSFSVPNPYYIPSVFNTLGFNYCFLHNVNLYPIDKPDGYSKGEIKKWEQEYEREETIPATKPNIIMVMGEAFSDLSNNEVFDWGSKEENPAYLYNLLAQSDRALTGHINVANIAAGTANTEFDVLTGMPTIMIGEGTSSAFRAVHKTVPTIASNLKELGYENRFLHPGQSWFYNRSNVYQYFGIEQQTFEEAFDFSTEAVSGMIRDDAFLRQLKEEFEAGSSPQFIYGVTIQNHQAYNYSKYPTPTPPVPVKKELSAQAMEFLSVYLRGVKDTSQMLYDLAEYLDSTKEPTLLVFFGDHLPNLGADYLAYRELGLDIGDSSTPQSALAAYTTPFMIYANEAYCEANDFAAAKDSLELQEEPYINAHYLGAMTLELAGYSGLDPYFDFLNLARRTLPAFRESEKIFLSSKGVYSDKVPDERAAEVIRKIDWWEYNRLK